MNKKEYMRQYDQMNKEKRKEYKKQWNLKNRDNIKQWNQNNKEKQKEYIKKWKHQNPDKKESKEFINQRTKTRKAIDPKYKLVCSLRTRLYQMLRGKRSRRTLEVLGCSPEQLTQHLESQFQPWMTWENMGGRSVSIPNTTWDVDHIIPLSSAQTEEDIYRLSHYTNLQPLCSYHNRFIKRDSL